MKRGQIWWAELAEPAGSEPGYRRPVVVVQSDDFTRSRIATVVVVILTTNLRLADSPGNVHLSTKESGLSRESVANISQITTLDREFLDEQIGELDHLTMQQIDEGIRLVLAL